MVQYDIETFLGDLKGLLVSDLNAKIIAINTEKADSIILKQVDDAAYILQSLDGPVVNLDPYILYGLDDITSTGIGPQTQKKYIVSVVLALSDNGQDPDIAKRMFRYSRSLEELIHDGWSKIRSSVKLKIESLVPIEFTKLNTGENFRAVGVSIEVNLA